MVTREGVCYHSKRVDWLQFWTHLAGVRLVKDTNIFVAALKSGAGASRRLLNALLYRKHAPLMGDKLWLEMLDVAGRSDDTWKGCSL